MVLQNPISARLLTFLTVASLALPLLDGDLDEARRRAEAEDWEGAVSLLDQRLRRAPDDVEALELIGTCLLALDRRDEAAHYIDGARARLALAGDARRAKALEKDLARADGLARKRAALFKTLSRDLARTAEKLAENGQTERAHQLLVRLLPVAEGDVRASIETVIERLGAAAAEVDLDAAAGEAEAPEGATHALIELESAHYRLACNLEPDVTQLVADTMDDIYGYYVRVYFDGDERKAPSVKATIRIHPTWDAMTALFPGGAPSPGLGGWWSPGSSEVHCFDTRDRGARLDEMLDTLFHEASHQFMTALARGSGTPAWLNEGTSCFFEGAVAMSDHRVLWPDAALDRLTGLAWALDQNEGPGVRAVLEYAGPGSYPGEYYAWGWGLVYFLQQWEDPETFEYAYRPLYARYREKVLGRSGSSLALFEEVFLGADSPLGHATLDDFVRDWRAWILETVRPLHFAPETERRARRLDLAAGYLARADVAAKEGRRAPISEDEYLLRALGHVEYVRTELDGAERPARDVLLLQAGLLERLERDKSAAALIESLLDLADEERVTLEEGEYSELEKRLARLDRGNYALRNLRSRTKTHTGQATRLLADYRSKQPDLVLRAYSFAAAAAEALGDEGELAQAAGELRALAREAGLLLGRVSPLKGARAAWVTPFDVGPSKLEVRPTSLTVAGVRPCALADTSVPVSGEYEVRAHLSPVGAAHLGSAWGLVVGGTPGGDWMIAGVNADGVLATWTVRVSPNGARLRPARQFPLTAPVEAGSPFELAARVTADGTLELRLDDREPVVTELGVELPPTRHAGVFVRDGEVSVEGLVVEVFP